jgi:integrase
MPAAVESLRPRFCRERDRSTRLLKLASPGLDPATKRAGLDGLTFHDLRRANATCLAGEGVDVKTAQIRLGHADPRTTLAIYAQRTSTADRVAAERVGPPFMTPADAGAPPDTTTARGMDAR